MITSALPYANGPIHLGHIAGAYLPADIHVRHLRRGRMCSGFVGAMNTVRRSLVQKEATSPEKSSTRTTWRCKGLQRPQHQFRPLQPNVSPKHHEVAQDFFLTLLDKGGFEVKTEEQFYDEEAKQFLADRYIQGTCPACGHDGAYGDQCENCGKTLSPTELVNSLHPQRLYARAQAHDTVVPPDGTARRVASGYIVDTLDGQPHHNAKEWKAHVLGQCRSWIDGGLESRAMTRDLDWGVPVPVDGAEGKVLHWLDAPIGYITATMEWCEQNDQDWRDWWQTLRPTSSTSSARTTSSSTASSSPSCSRSTELQPPDQRARQRVHEPRGRQDRTSRNWAVWVTEYPKTSPRAATRCATS